MKRLPQTASDRIASWMFRTWQEKTYLKGYDLHTDEISRSFRKRGAWVRTGVRCLMEAKKIRDKMSIPLNLMLSLELRSETYPLDITFGNEQELEQELNGYTPPSLYLLDNDLIQNFYDKVEIPLEVVGIGDCYGLIARYSETRIQEDEQLYRHVYVFAEKIIIH